MDETLRGSYSIKNISIESDLSKIISSDQSWSTHFSKLYNYHTKKYFHRTSIILNSSNPNRSTHFIGQTVGSTQYQKIFSLTRLTKNIFIEPKVNQLIFRSCTIEPSIIPKVGQLISSYPTHQKYFSFNQSWPTHFTKNIFINSTYQKYFHRTQSWPTQYQKIFSSNPLSSPKIFSSNPLSIPKNIFIELKVGQLNTKKYFHRTQSWPTQYQKIFSSNSKLANSLHRTFTIGPSIITELSLSDPLSSPNFHYRTLYHCEFVKIIA